MYLSTTSWLFGLLASGVVPALVSAQNNGSSLTEGTSPIFSVVPPTSLNDTETIAAINQGLSLYGFAIDTKNYSALSGVFAPDINAQVAPTPITNLQQYESFLQSDLEPYKTQHTTTTVFVYDIGPTTAQSASYAQAIYFGQKELLAQTVIFYERFNDEWTKGDDGSWKIAKRSLNIFGVDGNRNILIEQGRASLVNAGLAPPSS